MELAGSEVMALSRWSIGVLKLSPGFPHERRGILTSTLADDTVRMRTILI
jgi:hypothetical protein